MAGHKATIYEFAATPSDEKSEKQSGPLSFICWIIDSDHKVVRTYMHHGDPASYGISYDLIEYDIDIAADVFDVNIPAGYTHHLTSEERLKANGKLNIVELREAYGVARSNLPDYRMIVTDENSALKYQIARLGKQWRADFFNWYSQKKNGVSVDLSLDFDALWTHVAGTEANYREVTSVAFDGKAAIGYWVDGLPSRYSRLPDHSRTDTPSTLEGVGWPTMIIDNSNQTIDLISNSEKYPGCLVIRYINALNVLARSLEGLHVHSS